MLRRMRLRGAVTTLAVALTVTACGKAGPDTAARLPPTDPSLMTRIQQGGKIAIGVEFDQPGMGEKNPATGALSGFDIAIANAVAAQLGVKETDIQFTPTTPGNRDSLLSTGAVDLIVSAYPITDARRALVGQAGPYLVTGQQLLVRKDETTITGPTALRGKKVCAVSGSAALNTAQSYGAKPTPADTDTACVTQLLNKTVDAVTADAALLSGYLPQQPGKLKLIGQPFTTVRYGIGFKHGDTETCNALRDALVKIFANGDWARAFRDTLGKAGVHLPVKPAIDPTC